MGPITHNRIYVCIGASLCPVIIDLVASSCVIISCHDIVGPVVISTLPTRSSFSPKDALTPLSPSAPSPPLLLRRWRLPLPCQKSGTPVAGAVAPAGDRAGRGRPTVGPLCRRRAISDQLFFPQAPPLTGAAGLPFGLALAVGGQSYMGAGRGWPPLLLAAFTMQMQ
ncbi:hypothetical protein B296_00013775 [Ensete ventricosum]|uniref:Uncharacterized protein n=1 Tax=Ensete ventricosum TaxID=4639 RepID=A0A426X8V5_ENSVE|nr:hypothetical protein B296_00013775 [Ensete ventricosum]